MPAPPLPLQQLLLLPPPLLRPQLQQLSSRQRLLPKPSLLSLPVHHPASHSPSPPVPQQPDRRLPHHLSVKMNLNVFSFKCLANLAINYLHHNRNKVKSPKKKKKKKKKKKPPKKKKKKKKKKKVLCVDT